MKEDNSHMNYSPFRISQYTMITREKEIENDRDRILRRFHFGNGIGNKGEGALHDNSITKSHKTTKSIKSKSQTHSMTHSNNKQSTSHCVSVSPSNSKAQTQLMAKKRPITPINANPTRNKQNRPVKPMNSKSLSISICKQGQGEGSNKAKGYHSINTTSANTVTLNLRTIKPIAVYSNNTIKSKSRSKSRSRSSVSLKHSQNSEDTEKESKSHLVLINHKLTEDFNLIQDHPTNTNDNNDNDNDNDSLTELNHLNQKHISIGGNYLPISNDSSSHDQPQTRTYHPHHSHSHTNTHSQSHSETNFIQQYNNDNLRFINYSATQAKNKKLKQLFAFNPIYNISTRLLNDEISNQHHISTNEEYRFIKEVKADNDQLRKIHIISLLKLSDCALYNLLSYCYDNYEEIVLKCHKLITSKINLTLNNIYEGVIKQFIDKYSNVLKLESYTFKEKTIKRPRLKYKKASHPILNLILRVKVITSLVNKSFTIAYHHISKGIEYKDEWRFDIKDKAKPTTLWFTSEVEIYNSSITRHCYMQPLAAYSKGDVMELHMNVFSRSSTGGVNPFSICFDDLVITDSPKGFYQKSLLKSPYAYDPLYACEIENMIHIWKSSQALEWKGRIEDVQRYFKKHFIIRDIVFDYSKICFYKIRMKANVEGRVRRNQYVNFDIEILGSDHAVRNEIQVLGLLNTALFSDCVQIRKGSIVILYMTDFLPEVPTVD